MKTKTAALAAGIALAAFAASIYASPHWQLYRMRAAVEARDAQALARHVDFPRLRESVKVLLLQRLGAGSLADKDRHPLAAFGQAMARAVIDPVVDAAVSPMGVAAMLEAGDVRVRALPRAQEPAADNDERPRERPNYDLSYRSWDQVTVRRADGGGAVFVLDRAGLWRWKLAAVELPQD